MIRFFVLLISIYSVFGLSCTEMKTVYNDRQCCSDNTVDTCLRALPLCTDTDVVAGQVCTDSNGNAFVKGLADAFDLSDTNKIILKKHLIPDTNAQYDLGSAEYKIRYLFQSN